MSDRQFDARLSLALLAIWLFVILSFVGCAADNPYVDAWNQGASIAESKLDENEFYQDHLVKEYFEQVGTDRNYAFVLYRDLRTDVMYVKYTFSSYNKGCASFSVMYAADGTPLLYSEWLALEADQEGGAAE